MANDLLSLLDAVNLIPGRPHLNTVRRWAARKTGVKLRTVKMGKARMTRPEWVHEFVDAYIEATPDKYRDDSPAPTSSHQRAVKKLAEMGV